MTLPYEDIHARRQAESLARGNLVKQIVTAAEERLSKAQVVTGEERIDGRVTIRQKIHLKSPDDGRETLSIKKAIYNYGQNAPETKEEMIIESYVLAASTRSPKRLYIIGLNPDVVTLSDDEASVAGIGAYGGFHHMDEWQNMLQSIQTWQEVIPATTLDQSTDVTV